MSQDNKSGFYRKILRGLGHIIRFFIPGNRFEVINLLVFFLLGFLYSYSMVSNSITDAKAIILSGILMGYFVFYLILNNLKKLIFKTQLGLETLVLHISGNLIGAFLWVFLLTVDYSTPIMFNNPLLWIYPSIFWGYVSFIIIAEIGSRISEKPISCFLNKFRTSRKFGINPSKAFYISFLGKNFYDGLLFLAQHGVLIFMALFLLILVPVFVFVFLGVPVWLAINSFNGIVDFPMFLMTVVTIGAVLVICFVILSMPGIVAYFSVRPGVIFLIDLAQGLKGDYLPIQLSDSFIEDTKETKDTYYLKDMLAENKTYWKPIIELSFFMISVYSFLMSFVSMFLAPENVLLILVLPAAYLAAVFLIIMWVFKDLQISLVQEQGLFRFFKVFRLSKQTIQVASIYPIIILLGKSYSISSIVIVSPQIESIFRMVLGGMWLIILLGIISIYNWVFLHLLSLKYKNLVDNIIKRNKQLSTLPNSLNTVSK